MRRAAVLLIVLTFGFTVRPAQAQGGRGAATSGASKPLPPLSYICPMPGDEDVIEDKPGRCPKCGMELEGIRLDTVYTCLTNTAIIRDEPGKCPTDGRALVPMTMSVSFVCPNAPDVKESINPGTCPDGSAKQKKYAPRAHGNHNPQHGGGFFMAPDNWHHLEGAYYSTGAFRLYLYDDFTRPLPLKDVRETKARLILKDGKEVPLVRNGRFLEAKLGKLPLPTAVQAKVKFSDTSPEHQFDFTFDKYSVDVATPPATGPSVTSVTSAPSTNTAPTAPTTSPVPTAPTASPVPAATATPPLVEVAPSSADAGGTAVTIPESVPEIVSQLNSRNAEIKAFIDRGSFASVYVPAFQAKDLALALDAKKGDLSADKQRALGPAVKRLVRTSYLLDAFGDLGNKQQIIEAYAQFESAVKEISSAFDR